MENFEEQLRKDLHQFLLSMKEVDERMPECPDVEEKWEEIAKAYIHDGIREFQDFPSASLGWMMYIGMAVAKMWDTEWEIYSKIENIYVYMRDKRGYDAMDEYIREEVLLLQGIDYTVLEEVTGECASRGLQCLDAPTARTWHQGGLQRLRRLPAPALPIWSRNAAEAYGLPHDEDELKWLTTPHTRRRDIWSNLTRRPISKVSAMQTISWSSADNAGILAVAMAVPLSTTILFLSLKNMRRYVLSA